MTFDRLAQLPGKVIRKMCQASFMAFFAVLLGLVVILGNFQNEKIVRSLMLGIILWLLPNCYFVIKIMRRLGQVPGGDLLNIFYRAELIKLLFSGFFFIMMVKLLSVSFPVLLSGYLAAQLVFWLLLIIKSKEGLL
jgi:F0F1-type ATP synthase assembly protein I